MLFGIHPWDMLKLPSLKRDWYEQVTLRHTEREREKWQQALDVLGKMLSGGH